MPPVVESNERAEPPPLLVPPVATEGDGAEAPRPPAPPPEPVEHDRVPQREPSEGDAPELVMRPRQPALSFADRAELNGRLRRATNLRDFGIASTSLVYAITGIAGIVNLRDSFSGDRARLRGGLLLIPVVGGAAAVPVIDSRAGIGWAIASSVIQAGGVTLAIVGARRRRHAMRRLRIGAAPSTQGLHVGMSVQF